MVAVLLAVAALAVVLDCLAGEAIARRFALLPVVAGVVVVGSGLRVPMCGGARRRLELAADSP